MASLCGDRTIDGFDFTDLTPFQWDVPHAALAKLRRDAPVHWHPAPSVTNPRDGFWLITRHQDIVSIEKQPTLFSSHGGLTLAPAPAASAPPPWSMLRDGLTHLDPPDHAAHRQLVAPAFTPRAIAAIEADIRRTAGRILDRACELGTFDFAAEVALLFPVTVVLGQIFGLPEEHFQRVVRWSDVIAAPRDPEFTPAAGFEVVREIYEYALETAAARRSRPTNDVLSLLANTTNRDGQVLTDEVFARYFWSLVTGAFDTTASAIAGGMQAFLQFPGEFTRLCAQPQLIATAVEEILRWETPTIYFRRTATADTVLGGQPIKSGQRVVMCYASANRDEAVFSMPTVFDIGRRPNEHLSFGHGTHFCLGSSLARLEIRVLFEELIARRIQVELRGEIRRAKSNFQNRIKRMPVTIARA